MIAPSLTILFGRRLSKTTPNETEYYLYDGHHEIGAFTKHLKAKQLRVLAPGTLPRAIALELEGEIFAPLYDIQGSITHLIDPSTRQVVANYSYSAFGEESSSFVPFNPWRYASKRLDPETNLIYFGHRFYDPDLGRFLSLDPLEFINSYNLYLYAFNNPFRYCDPDGRLAFVIAIPFSSGALRLPSPSQPHRLSPLLPLQPLASAQHGRRKSKRNRVKYEPYTIVGGQVVSNEEEFSKFDRSSNGGVDPTLADDPEHYERSPDWQNVSHPEANAKGHKTYENIKTGERIRYDEGKPGTGGHKERGHYHRENPETKWKNDEFLDHKGDPCGKGTDASHLYPPSWIYP